MNEEQVKTEVRVVIIGAGAAGLKCANHLVAGFDSNDNFRPDDVLILEARDRTGGRIHTIDYSSKGNTENVNFPLDLGAAWVHGTGEDWGSKKVDDTSYPNPIVNLLLRGEINSRFNKNEDGDDKNNINNEQEREESINAIYSHLDPISPVGNAWLRPYFAMHQTNIIALFVNGVYILNSDPVIIDALKRQKKLLQKVSDFGAALSNKGLGSQAIHISLQETIECIEKESERIHSSPRSVGCDTVDAEYEADDIDQSIKKHNLIESIMQFYMYLMETWHSSSTSELRLDDFTQAHGDWDDDKDYKDEGDFYGPHCTVRDGMSSILKPLFGDGISERILLNQEVTRIQYKEADGERCSKKVVVSTSSGLEVIADYCVVTMPINCLKEAIKEGVEPTKRFFEPQLSNPKIDAIQSIRMGYYKKVFMTFDRIFWPSTNEPFMGLVVRKDHGRRSSPIGDSLFLNNLWAAKGIPCLEAILVANAGKWAVQKSDDEIRTVVLDFIADALGTDIVPTKNDIHTYCTKCHITRWEEDKYSLGSYSGIKVGTHERHVDELNRPEWDGKLLFAGEANTYKYQGAVHSALFSGIDVAAQIQKRGSM